MLEINSLKAEIMDTEHVHIHMALRKKHVSMYLSMKFPFPQRFIIRQLFKVYSHKTCKCLKMVQWFVCMYIFQNIKKKISRVFISFLFGLFLKMKTIENFVHFLFQKNKQN